MYFTDMKNDEIKKQLATDLDQLLTELRTAGLEESLERQAADLGLQARILTRENYVARTFRRDASGVTEP